MNPLLHLYTKAYLDDCISRAEEVADSNRRVTASIFLTSLILLGVFILDPLTAVFDLSRIGWGACVFIMAFPYNLTLINPFMRRVREVTGYYDTADLSLNGMFLYPLLPVFYVLGLVGMVVSLTEIGAIVTICVALYLMLDLVFILIKCLYDMIFYK